MSNASSAPTYQSGQRSVAPSGTAAPADVRAAALQFLAHLATEISSGTVDLPCFPNIVLRIRTALADPKNTPENTVNIIGAEPRLAARLMQTANSAALNRSGKPVTDLRTAINRLGHQIVQSAAMAFAVQHMKDEASLSSIVKPMTELWEQSVSVALICQVVARNTKVKPDEAFLAGLMHGMGRLYVMVRAIGRVTEFGQEDSFAELIDGWQASIGKAVLENWAFAPEICEAVGNQQDYGRRRKVEPDLSDVLIASIVMASALRTPAPHTVDIEGITAFQTLGLAAQDWEAILTHAGLQIASLQEALGG